jgi:hypothetical protein
MLDTCRQLAPDFDGLQGPSSLVRRARNREDLVKTHYSGVNCGANFRTVTLTENKVTCERCIRALKKWKKEKKDARRLT